MLNFLYLFWLLNYFYGHITPVCSQIKEVFISDPYPSSSTNYHENSKGLAYVTYKFTSGPDIAAMCHRGNLYNWTDTEADVVCRQSGYEGGFELGRLLLRYINHHIIKNTHCTGDERFLEDCSYDEPVYSDEGCGELGYVGVSCYIDNKWITYTNQKGVIESQNFPDPYPNKAAYTYIISVADALTINVLFLNLRLEKDYDFIYMGTGSVPTSLQQTELVFTGLKQPNETTVTFLSDEIWIRFISDNANPTRLKNLQYSFKWEATIKQIPDATTPPPKLPKTPVSSPDDRDNPSDPRQNATANPITMVTKDNKEPQANTQSNLDVVVGASMGIVLCLIIIIIVVVIILYKRRGNSKIDSSNGKSSGLAFNGPYDVTVQNGASVFVGANANQGNGIPIPHFHNAAYDPEGHDNVSSTHDHKPNQNGDGYDYIGNQDVTNNTSGGITSGGRLENSSYNQESNPDDNIYHDISDETNAYNYIDNHINGEVTYDECNAEGIYEDTSGMHMENADNNDNENEGIYAV